MLVYKAKMYEKIVTVNPRNITQICHDCGFAMEIGAANKLLLTLAKRNWTCLRLTLFVTAARNVNIRADSKEF